VCQCSLLGFPQVPVLACARNNVVRSVQDWYQKCIRQPTADSDKTCWRTILSFTLHNTPKREITAHHLCTPFKEVAMTFTSRLHRPEVRFLRACAASANSSALPLAHHKKMCLRLLQCSRITDIPCTVTEVRIIPSSVRFGQPRANAVIASSPIWGL
jgi:hypothetical protein